MHGRGHRRAASFTSSCEQAPTQTPLQRLRERVVQVGERASSLRVNPQRLVDGAREIARKIAAVVLQRRYRLADSPRCRGRGAPTDRVDATEGLVQDERERVEIGGRTGLAPLALLGSHVGERAEHVARPRQDLATCEQRTAEVSELGGGRQAAPLRRALRRLLRLRRIVCDQDVLRLDVTMDHSARVSVRERVGQREPDLDDLLVAQRVLLDQLRERVPLDQLGDQVEGVPVRARLVEGDDRRMRQAGGRVRLSHRTVALLHGGQRDSLESDRAAQLLVARTPDRAKAAHAQPLEQPIAPEHQLAASLRALVADTNLAAEKGLGGFHAPGFAAANAFPCRRIGPPAAGR
jgi:hypothetical protein